jgi:hypothetical protein
MSRSAQPLPVTACLALGDDGTLQAQSLPLPSYRASTPSRSYDLRQVWAERRATGAELYLGIGAPWAIGSHVVLQRLYGSICAVFSHKPLCAVSARPAAPIAANV